MPTPKAKSQRPYDEALGFGKELEADNEPRWRALERAHDIRKFEIELYWKRATYFFALQVAAFTALGFSLPSRGSSGAPVLALILACMGTLTALSSYLSSKGSKFWLSNWELHIDSLEDEFEGRLHKAVWLPKGQPQWSVSRVNEAMGRAFLALWLAILIYVLVWLAREVRVWGLCQQSFDPDATGRLLTVISALPATGWFARSIWQSKSVISGHTAIHRDVEGQTWELKVRSQMDRQLKPPA